MSADTQTRVKALVMVTTQQGVQAMHFVGIPELEGNNNELWFPLMAHGDLFNSIEITLQLNNICHNLSRCAPIRQCGNCVDYELVYNKKPA